MTDKDAMKLALDAFEDTHYRIISAGLLDQDLLNRNFTVATALRERLAQPEPIQSLQCAHCQVTIETLNDKVMHLLAQRTWVSLTDEEILSDDTLRYYYGMNGGAGPVSQKGKKVIAAIEAKLKQKNGYAEEKNT